MEYISGIYALNLECELNTPGDWHQVALDWDEPFVLESSKSIYKDYGIEKNKNIVFLNKKYNVANHIRALLDLLVLSKFSQARGMRKDYICNDQYNDEIFKKVILLNGTKNWDKIDDFMSKEYYMKWVNFKKEHLDG